MLLNRGRRHDNVFANVFERTPAGISNARFFLLAAVLHAFQLVVKAVCLQLRLHYPHLLFRCLQTQPLSSAVERHGDLCGDARVQRRVVLLASPDRLVIQNLSRLIDLAVRYWVALWVVSAH